MDNQLGLTEKELEVGIDKDFGGQGVKPATVKVRESWGLLVVWL